MRLLKLEAWTCAELTCQAEIFFERTSLTRSFNLRSCSDSIRDADLLGAAFCNQDGTEEEIRKSEAIGLTPESFGGANLTHCMLPKHLRDFSQIKAVEDASKDGMKVMFTEIVACIFCLLSAGVFTDASLLTEGSVTSALQAVGLTLPVDPFIAVAPSFYWGFTSTSF